MKKKKKWKSTNRLQKSLNKYRSHVTPCTVKALKICYKITALWRPGTHLTGQELIFGEVKDNLVYKTIPKMFRHQHCLFPSKNGKSLSQQRNQLIHSYPSKCRSQAGSALIRESAMSQEPSGGAAATHCSGWTICSQDNH